MAKPRLGAQGKTTENHNKNLEYAIQHMYADGMNDAIHHDSAPARHWWIIQALIALGLASLLI
jgi:hypothetical protein